MKKGKWFEDKSKMILSDFFPKGTLVHSEKNISTKWGGFRKVDIGVGSPGDFDYIIFECKDWKSTAGPSTVDYALGIMRDVGAKKAALLLNGKLSENGIKKAKYEGLEVFNIINPKEEKLRPKLKAKVLSHFIWIQKYKYALLFGEGEHNIYGDPESVFLEDGENIKTLLKKLWNTGKLNKYVGVHSYTINKFFMVKAPKIGVKLAAVDGVRIDYEVTKKTYTCDVELSKGEGLYNVLKGEFIPTSNNISFGPLSIEKIIEHGSETSRAKDIKGIAFESHLLHVIP